MLLETIDKLIYEMIEKTGKEPSVIEIGVETYISLLDEIYNRLGKEYKIKSYKGIPIKLLKKMEGIIVMDEIGKIGIMEGVNYV